MNSERVIGIVRRVALCSAGVFAHLALAGGETYSLVPLTGMPAGAAVHRLNNAGQVSGVIPPSTLVRWEAGRAITTELDAVGVSVEGLSESGLVAGSAMFEVSPGDFAFRPFIWDPDTGGIDVLDSISPIFVAGVNDSRLLIGIAEDKYGFALDPNTEAFTPLVLDGIPKENIGALGGMGLNDQGIVVGSDVIFLDPPGFFAEVPYRWTAAAGIAPIATNPSSASGRAVDINESGVIAGTSKNEFFEDVLAVWTDDGATLTELGVPFGYFVISRVGGINNSGHIAFDVPNDFFGFTRSYIWDGEQFIDLTESLADPGVANIVNAWDINDSGDVLALVETIAGNQFMIVRPDAPPTHPADFDGDGDVDSTDLNVLLAAFGCTSSCASGDVDDDGDVDSADLNLLLAAFGL